MRLKAYDEHDGRKVWLGRDEVELFMSKVEGTEESIGLGLAVRCGLRSKEIVGVKPADLVHDDIVGHRVRVEQGKGGWYREVPMPATLERRASTLVDIADLPHDEPIVDRATRTIQRWTNRVAERCEEETGDSGWRYLSPHDLRGSWGTLLIEAGVEPGMIMEWGGWKDWETFRDHYLGAYSPDMERRQAALVPWLDAEADNTVKSDRNGYMSVRQSPHHG